MFPSNFLTLLLLSTCIGTLSAYLAVKQRKNPYFWFFIGIFFGLLGVIAIFFAPPQKRKKQPANPWITESFIAGPSNKFWYYLDVSHKQVGPMSLAALSKAWKAGTVLSNTFVWHEDLTDWKPLEECIQTRKVPAPGI